MSDSYERGYQTGYRAALGAAAAECRKHAEALDHGGNTYTRYGDAIRLASAILSLRVPAATPQAQPGEDAECKALRLLLAELSGASEEDRERGLVSFFRTDGATLGRYGDSMGWTPEQTASHFAALHAERGEGNGNG